MEWTGARYADTPTVQVQTRIAAPPERVWAIITEIELMPSMSTELQSVRWQGGASGPGLGNTFVGRNKNPALGEWETTSFVVECDAPRVFAWAVSDPEQPSARWRFTLQPADGGTQLQQWAQLGPGPSGLSIAITRMPEKEQKIVHVRLRDWETAMQGTLLAIIRQAFAGEKISYSGNQFEIPRPGGEGRPMRLSMPANPDIPIYLASMSPKLLELTGEVADGWLGTSFVPEGSAAYFSHLDAGLAKAGRTRAGLDVCQGAEVAFANDEDAVRAMVAGRKKELAFSLGGMGSAGTNFYNNAYSRQGWADVAAAVRERWQAGDRDGAASLVTDEMVLGTTLIGTEGMVRARLGVWRDAGVDTVRLYPAGDTLDARLTTLGRALELVREVG